MRLMDGTILWHGSAPYDPVKAHEYYLRTRELKGRRNGRTASSIQRRPRVGDYTVKTPKGATYQLTAQQLKEQQAYAAERVSEIKKRLHELGDKLKKLLADAEANKPTTAAEKTKKAHESKQYRREHRQELANKAKHRRVKTHRTTKKDSVDAVKDKIKQVKSRLHAAVEVQRALSAATLNRSSKT